MKFINRTRELATLNEIAAWQGAQRVVLYGRRRIGKTALLTHWLQQQAPQNHVYWVAR